MAVCIYSEGKWQSLAGKKISKDGEWKSLGDFDRMKIGDSWHRLGFAEIDTNTVEVPPVMQFRNGAEPTDGTKWYVTPNGSGDLSGSSWENAASTDTLRLVAANAVSGDSIYFSEGVYSFSQAISLPSDVTLYGGFGVDDLTWESRNGFTHQTRITDTNLKNITLLDGFVMSNMEPPEYNAIKNCILTDCDNVHLQGVRVLYDTVIGGNLTENCLFRHCTCDSDSSSVETSGLWQHANLVFGRDCFFSDCEFTSFATVFLAAASNGVTYVTRCFFKNCQFYKCYFDRQCVVDVREVNNPAYTSDFSLPELNCTFVQCVFKDYYTNNEPGKTSCFIGNCFFADSRFEDIVHLERSTIINSKSEYSFYVHTSCCINSEIGVLSKATASTFVNSVTKSTTSGLSSVSWNSGIVFPDTYSASSDYTSEGITLGNDNLLAKFTDTGYYPARGVQSLGGCPCPFDDPDGYAAYVASFGDWHPLPDSVLVGRGKSIGGTDLDGVTRPDYYPTIGCYEPRPQETE